MRPTPRQPRRRTISSHDFLCPSFASVTQPMYWKLFSRLRDPCPSLARWLFFLPFFFNLLTEHRKALGLRLRGFWFAVRGNPRSNPPPHLLPFHGFSPVLSPFVKPAPLHRFWFPPPVRRASCSPSLDALQLVFCRPACCPFSQVDVLLFRSSEQTFFFWSFGKVLEPRLPPYNLLVSIRSYVPFWSG